MSSDADSQAPAAGPDEVSHEAPAEKPSPAAGAENPSLSARAYERWCDFWFEPQETSTLALIRIAFGLTVFAWAFSLLPDLRVFFSNEGLLAHPLELQLGGLWEPFSGSTSYGILLLAWFILLLASICLTLGVGTRIACLVIWLCILAYTRRNPFVFDSGDPYFRIVAFYLALTPASAALSLPRWFRERDKFWEFPKRSLWGLRLLQIQVSILYMTAFFDKVSLAPVWDNGTALSYILRLQQLERFPSFILFPTNSLPINLATYGTLVVEGSLAVLIWNRRLRPYVIVAGVCLHLGIEYSIRVGFFSIISIVALCSFVAPTASSHAILATRDWFAARRAGGFRPSLHRPGA